MRVEKRGGAGVMKLSLKWSCAVFFLFGSNAFSGQQFNVLDALEQDAVLQRALESSSEGRLTSGSIENIEENGIDFSLQNSRTDAVSLETRWWPGVEHGRSAPLKAKTVVLYSGPGVWPAGRKFLEKFLRYYGIPYRTVGPKGLIEGGLDLKRDDVLIMPGGKSWVYLRNLKEAGGQIIRDFVAKGGGYFGICAGAYYATARRIGKGLKAGTGTNGALEESPETRGLDAASGGTPDEGIPYGIGLLDGAAYDGESFKESGYRNGMRWFEMLQEGWKSFYKILMLGGPSFHFTAQERALKKITVLANFAVGRKQPGMIYFNYGAGRVFLSGPHPEVEEHRYFWGIPYRDPDSEWPMIWQAMLALKGQQALLPPPH